MMSSSPALGLGFEPDDDDAVGVCGGAATAGASSAASRRSRGRAPPSPRYGAILREFVAFLRGRATPYPRDHQFAEEELSAVTPSDVVRYMSLKSYGVPDPAPDAPPMPGGAGPSSLEFYKKALSYYMPRRDEPWDDDEDGGGVAGGGGGNPTRSRTVQEFVRRVAAAGAPPPSAGGGKRKRGDDEDEDEDNYKDDDNVQLPQADDGPRGMLRRAHAQNLEFLGALDAMGTALAALGRTVERMRRAIETSDVAIRTELAKQRDDGGQTGGGRRGAGMLAEEVDGAGTDLGADEGEGEAASDDADLPAPKPEPHREGAVPDAEPADLLLREDVARAADALRDFVDPPPGVAALGGTRVVPGPDGYCSFEVPPSNGAADGREEGEPRPPRRRAGASDVVPPGFDLPSCDLSTAWRAWLVGFPDHKLPTADGTGIVDAPIRPLRLVRASDLPTPGLRKKFKDGWRPILTSMHEDVRDVVESRPRADVGEAFARETYEAAMAALARKAPEIFADASGGAEKCGTWRVATWSRKARERGLGRRQVRRRTEGAGDAAEAARARRADPREPTTALPHLDAVQGHFRGEDQTHPSLLENSPVQYD